MHYDALTTAAIADEWRRTLVGGRIDKIFQPDAWSLALLVRSQQQNRQVLLALNPRFARATLVSERKLGSGFDVPTAFVMLLRKHLEGARISAVDQPPLERILHLTTARGADPRRTLVVELLGRQSNALLLDEQGIVLGVLRPVTSEMSRSRVLLPHHPYVPPPPAAGTGASRLDPRDVSGSALTPALTAAEEPLVARLPRLLAISPTVAREAVYRASGDARAVRVDPEALAEALRDLFAPLAGTARWDPSLARNAGAVLAFAPYPLRHLTDSAVVEPSPSISLAVERYFVPREAEDRVEGRRSRLRSLVRSPLERAERRAAGVAQQLSQAQERLALRHAGELLLTYQPVLEPGQREVMLDDYETGRTLAVAVDPRRDAVRNAEELFRQYQRAKRAIVALEPQQAEAALDVAFGRQLLHDVALCVTPGDLVALEQEIRASGYLGDRGEANARRRAKAKGARKGERVPAATVVAPVALDLDGVEVLYGKSSLGNDQLTFRLAARQDLWLHAKGVPGSHVVIRSGGRRIPDAVLTRAAAVAAYLSDARGEGRAAVDYTAVGNVRRQPGGKPGLVYYVGERTVQVAPRAPEALASQEVVHAE